MFKIKQSNVKIRDSIRCKNLPSFHSQKYIVFQFDVTFFITQFFSPFLNDKLFYCRMNEQTLASIFEFYFHLHSSFSLYSFLHLWTQHTTARITGRFWNLHRPTRDDIVHSQINYFYIFLAQCRNDFLKNIPMINEWADLINWKTCAYQMIYA